MSSRNKPARLERQLDALEVHYGSITSPPARGPFELVLWENVAYLQTDERRAEVFRALKSKVGLSPAKLRAASHDTLLEIASRGGMHPERRVERLLDIAERVLDRHDGELESVLALPVPKALRALQAFPGIGKPGAEKILLFTGTHALPALESNGLRVLVRLGWAKDGKSYDATYRAVQDAVREELPATCQAWTRAHLLLRHHGQQLCKNSGPACEDCALEAECSFARA
jgi:endonuclease III